jgi:hypothetical protein
VFATKLGDSEVPERLGNVVGLKIDLITVWDLSARTCCGWRLGGRDRTGPALWWRNVGQPGEDIDQGL